MHEMMLLMFDMVAIINVFIGGDLDDDAAAALP